MDNRYEVKPAEQLYYAAAGEMHPSNTYFHFSFAEYNDPENIQFGPLRVLNDDEVQPESGFGRHPHRDVEIISYIISGKLTHWDSAKDVEETLEPGDVQIITAGSGVVHSEFNHEKEPCRLLQIWFLPPERNLPVQYETRKFSTDERTNKLLQIVGNLKNRNDVPLYLNQDVNVYVSEISQSDQVIEFQLKKNRQAYINVIDGELKVNDETPLRRRDSAKIYGESELKLSSNPGSAHFIILEMAEG